MAVKIFICYRRDDDSGFAQLLHKFLAEQFPAADLFMDIEGHVKPGDDFVKVINDQVAAADVTLVVIGHHWSELLAARANDPDDFVLIEIRAALENNKRVIPVLVGGAVMPRADSLPETIRPLARRNAVGLRPGRFNVDCKSLIRELKEQFAAAAAAEAVHLKEVRRTEELESWNKVGGDVEALRDHIARFRNGETSRYALDRLDEAVWMALDPRADITQLRKYPDEFPDGPHAAEARDRIFALEIEAPEREALEKEVANAAKRAAADASRRRRNWFDRGLQIFLFGLFFGSLFVVVVYAVLHPANPLPASKPSNFGSSKVVPFQSISGI